MNQQLSVLIITYNRPDDLLELMESFAAQEGAAMILKEMLILNNASTIPYDCIHPFAAAHPELKIHFIDNDENLGVARGRNKLISIAKGALLLVIDDDTILPATDSLVRFSKLFDQPLFQENNTAVITPRIIYHSNKEVQKSAFPQKDYEEYKDKQQFLSPYFVGCTHLMKRELFDKTGFYPTDFFYGMEEYDLAYRIADAGYSMGYDNSITIEHKESPLGRQAQYNKLGMMWLNKTKVAWRYLPKRYFFTTALAWSIEYLRKIKGHFGTFFKIWWQILCIPFTEKRQRISRKALFYLKTVKARLSF